MPENKMLFTKDTFKYLFDKYYSPLRAYASRYISDNSANDDIVQDVFTAFWKKAKDFNNEKAVKTYLFYSVRNACLNYLRKNNPSSLEDNQIELPTVEDGIIEETVFMKVKEAIQELSEQEQVIINRWMNGLGNAEIAEDINVSINTIKTVKKRAYTKLREKLKGLEWVLVYLLS